MQSIYPKLKDLPEVDPTPVPKAEFPRDEHVPEGCVVLDGTTDDPGYSLDYRTGVYRVATGADGRERELRYYALVPCDHNPLRATPPEGGYPAVVFCQGSAFHRQWLHGHFVQHVELARRGYVVVSVEYRPSEVAPFPAQSQDLRAAVRFVREHAADLWADPSRIALWGDSSGAHTALMAAYGAAVDGVDPEGVSCVVDWYGPTDFALMSRYPSAMDHVSPDSPEGFELGRVSPLADPDGNAAASPLTLVTPDTSLPPTLIVHGGRDELVPFNQSCRLFERLRACGQEVEFYKLPDANHGANGFGRQVLDLTEKFISRHMA